MDLLLEGIRILFNQNKEAFENKNIVKKYSKMHFLFKPEEVALEKIKLTNKKMLDIGVGTGRTTRFFSPKTKKYIGIDYSKNMIKKCIETFETSEKRKFLIRDIRRFDYPGFFDFILFSYNGIDYMDHKDRKKSLIIIKNLLNEEGIFLFSTHNINYLDTKFKLKLTINPIYLLLNIRKYLLLRKYNVMDSNYKNKNYAIVNDGTHNFKLYTHYIKPSFQIKQLYDLGFSEIQVISLNGDIHDSNDYIDSLNDYELHYLCYK